MLLDMNGICKDYMQGKLCVRVLTDVSLQVEEGDYLAIMGPSGSGKTTLMNLIGCLDVPTQGTYLLNGEDIGGLKSNKLAQVRNETLGFVFQSFYLLPKMSALDNVALPLLYAGVPKRERRARAKVALERMGLGDRLDFRPNQLSGGQCQRVAIARAIVTNPKLLLADEPTGALDSASGNQIMDIFDELNESGVTIIMITHEHEVAARAKRICHIRDGVLSGGMPGYEVHSKDEEAKTYEEADTREETDAFEDGFDEEASSMAHSLPEGEAEDINRWVEQFLAEERKDSEEPREITQAVGAEISFDTQELPKWVSETAVDFETEGQELRGHGIDLFADVADVFDSPDAVDVFASPEVGDVFSQQAGEESDDFV